ncbi:Hemin transport system permease protein HmuU [Tritonibacter multivorans]|uniref:Hemin transport system permease protein HmuU n=2 Tax=Tritonibacter multivorans TaxID=928856 RepID=A0A0P1GWN7_9RHOB|nr:iron ABC transporter permease [Tritonibacter multivorans]MDA7422124.1 iron ABC transporter permease [Tritonibacter multivorans]CUH78419.1 Hemin transport system permease protein HmuU [Tritonibacter multivorans]SFD16588.1 iron complex transport system permease protein [Tritonibacter multivorans]
MGAMLQAQMQGRHKRDVAGDRRHRARVVTICLSLGLMSVFLLSLGWGAAGQTHVIEALLASIGIGQAELRDTVILFDIRMPRTLLAAAVGAALAVSGAILQGLFRNPLADPGLIGVSAGAGFGAVAAIVLGGLLPLWLQGLVGFYLVPLAAFAGGWVSTILLYLVATRNGRTSVATMLLAGIALGALSGAVTGVIVFSADDDQLRDLTFWGMGSVAGATWPKVWTAGPLIILSLVAAPFLARSLNALALGEASARHLGIPVQRMKNVAILTVACSVGASVAVTGGIGFVGIVVPHLLRLVQGPDHRGLLINAGLLGAVMLLLADGVSRIVIAPAELPIGIVTALIGGPFFLWILLKNRKLVDV